MAKIKELKKDIDYIINSIISDCFACVQLNSDKNSDKVYEIINSATEKKTELISKIYKAPFDNKSENRKYFKALQSELIEFADTCFENLSKLIVVKK